jgi:hypothetical protein
MLVMKAWLETRWRLAALFAYPLIFMALNYQSRNTAPTARIQPLLVLLWLVLSCFVMTLAGSGVRSQSPIGFPEGLAESTQFTMALPVSRLKLLAVRAGVGMFETLVATVVIACLVWRLFPSVRAGATPADFARLVLTTLLWLALPYCAALFFQSLLAEPLSLMCAGWMLTLVVWLLHRIAPAVAILRAFGSESPLNTHRVPWSQMATSAVIALILFWATVRVVQRREY